MSKKLDRYDLFEMGALLTDSQLELLEGCAEETGLPATGWTAVPGLVVMARTWATREVARGLVGQVIDPNGSQRRFTASAALDAAEASLFKEGHGPDRGRPKSVRTNLARWRRDVRDED